MRTTESGRRMSEVGGSLVEVVTASANDLAALGMTGLTPGVYVVGTGGTGATETFLTLGSTYFVTIMLAAFAYRVPRDGWLPAGWQPPSPSGRSTPDGDSMSTTAHVDIDRALLTPQFYLLWTCLFTNVSAGIGVLAVAKTMMSDIFGSSMPTVVDGAFAASYVSVCSIGSEQALVHRWRRDLKLRWTPLVDLSSICVCRVTYR